MPRLCMANVAWVPIPMDIKGIMLELRILQTKGKTFYWLTNKKIRSKRNDDKDRTLDEIWYKASW